MTRLLLVVVIALAGLAACPKETPVMMWVDGFQPENVRFEVQDLGPQTAGQLQALKVRPDIDGALLLPAGSCPSSCKAAIISVFVTNRSKEKEPSPVIRLASPPGRARRLPIAFGAADIDPGRIGRIRWLIEMYPEERDLTATLSSSVRLDVTTTPQTEPPTKEPAEPPQDAPATAR
jgi:hypothetical protein